jgi:hypothetical protein
MEPRLIATRLQRIENNVNEVLGPIASAKYKITDDPEYATAVAHINAGVRRLGVGLPPAPARPPAGQGLLQPLALPRLSGTASAAANSPTGPGPSVRPIRGLDGHQ